MIAIWHIIQAITVGNTVVNKPSPYTPLSTLCMIEFSPTWIADHKAGRARTNWCRR
jgi:hypothetical protein